MCFFNNMFGKNCATCTATGHPCVQVVIACPFCNKQLKANKLKLILQIFRVIAIMISIGYKI